MSPELEPEENEVEEFEPAFKAETDKVEATSPEVIEQTEVLTDASELAVDRLDTIVLGTSGWGEMDNYFIVEKDDPEKKETKWNGTDPGTSLAMIKDYRGQYTDMNGFIAYVPKNGNEYCLMASTAENRAAVEAKGYEGNSNVGVFSFRGGEQLETRGGRNADPTFLNAQIELLKLQSERDGTESSLERARQSSDQAEIARLEAEHNAEDIAIQEARERVAAIAQEKPYLLTKFS